MASFMHSREGAMQEYPRDMVAYNIGIIPLIRYPKAAYPDVTPPWYADNAGALGAFNNIGLYFNLLKKISLGCGYTPNLPKLS